MQSRSTIAAAVGALAVVMGVTSLTTTAGAASPDTTPGVRTADNPADTKVAPAPRFCQDATSEIWSRRIPNWAEDPQDARMIGDLKVYVKVIDEPPAGPSSTDRRYKCARAYAEVPHDRVRVCLTVFASGQKFCEKVGPDRFFVSTGWKRAQECVKAGAWIRNDTNPNLDGHRHSPTLGC